LGWREGAHEDVVRLRGPAFHAVHDQLELVVPGAFFPELVERSVSERSREGQLVSMFRIDSQQVRVIVVVGETEEVVPRPRKILPSGLSAPGGSRS